MLKNNHLLLISDLLATKTISCIFLDGEVELCGSCWVLVHQDRTQMVLLALQVTEPWANIHTAYKRANNLLWC